MICENVDIGNEFFLRDTYLKITAKILIMLIVLKVYSEFFFSWLI